MNVDDDFAQLRRLLDARREWLLVDASGKSFALASNEIELELKSARMLVGFPADSGFQTWRIVLFEQKADEISLTLTRSFEKETAKIRFVPRVSASELAASVELARLEKANEIAALAVAEMPGAKLVRVALNAENGRLAEAIIESKNGVQIAVLSDISDTTTPEYLMAAAILRLAGLRARKQKPIETLRLVTEKKRAGNLQNLHALLRENWRGAIEIFEIVRGAAKAQSAENSRTNPHLKKLETLDFESLTRRKSRKIKPSANAEISRAAREIVRLAPGDIDVVLTASGETLRFRGLPFARVRRVSGAERVWFGVGAKRQALGERNLSEFAALVDELKIQRRCDAPGRRHEFYRLAPEAWLEAVLRADVKRLDANLILSPVYNQFRAERDKIDLLALRRDGRLIVVELKTAPDRAMIFQAADYWRKIEILRRNGTLRAARVFGNLEIADEPALVYLAAPLLSFHRDFDFLARAVSEKIEFYRFDLNENWRENLKVTRRGKVNG